MIKFIDRPQVFFWGSIPLILMIGWLTRDGDWDINIHDTYYIMSNWYLAEILAMLFLLIGGIYWGVLKSKLALKRWMNLAHLILSIDILILIGMVYKFNDTINNWNWFSLYNTSSTIQFILFLLFIVGQILFVINIIGAVFLNSKQAAI